MAVIKQLADGSFGIEGALNGDGGFVPVPFVYTAAITSTTIFVADRGYVVKGIRGRVDVAGTGGACTAVVNKVPSGTALASGTALHTGSFNLVGTALAQQALTLSATAASLVLVAGDSIAIVLTGTATSATGAFTVTLSPS